MTRMHHYRSYVIGSDLPLTDGHKQRLVACFEKAAGKAAGDLGGRAAVSSIRLDGIGPVVVKQYTRGGFIRHFNKTTYLKFSRYRSQSEYELLVFLGTIGVRVPEPIAFAFQGNFFYHAWIVTREIQNARSLIDISRKNPETASALMHELKQQVDILVENQIHHVDLHPGNVLADDQDTLFILDFDKARTTPQNRARLKKKYIRRWQRAVLKYRLPAVLTLN